MTEDLERALLNGLPQIEVPEFDIGAAAEAGLLDVAYALEDSPVGRLLLASTERGLVRIAYLDTDEDEERALEQLAAEISPRVLAAAPDGSTSRGASSRSTSPARRNRFDVPLDWRLTHGFARRVLQATARIPFGEVVDATRASPLRPAARGASAPPATRSARIRSRSSSPATGCCTRAAGSAATPAGSSARRCCSASRVSSRHGSNQGLLSA